MSIFLARHIDLTASYVAIGTDNVYAHITISAPTTNATVSYLEGDTGDDVELYAGEWHVFNHVNLGDIKAKGTVGDILTVVGEN